MPVLGTDVGPATRMHSVILEVIEGHDVEESGPVHTRFPQTVLCSSPADSSRGCDAQYTVLMCLFAKQYTSAASNTSHMQGIATAD